MSNHPDPALRCKLLYLNFEALREWMHHNHQQWLGYQQAHLRIQSILRNYTALVSSGERRLTPDRIFTISTDDEQTLIAKFYVQ